MQNELLEIYIDNIRSNIQNRSEEYMHKENIYIYIRWEIRREDLKDKKLIYTMTLKKDLKGKCRNSLRN